MSMRYLGTDGRTVTFRGRASTFVTWGRAGTTGQKILALFNASATKLVSVNRVMVDNYQLTVKVVTVAPPIIRLHRITALPTNGSGLAKVPLDTALTSDASVTAHGDASADRTASATTLTATIPAGSMLTQEIAPRIISATTEVADRVEFLVGEPDVVLRQNQGVLLNIDYNLATSNPQGTATAGDSWVAVIDWEEYNL